MMDKISGHYLHFPGQHKDEQVKIIFRRSIFFLAINYVFTIIMASLAWCLSFVLPTNLAILQQNTILLPVFYFIITLIIIFIFYIAFLTWTHYYLDTYIITNQRILTIDQIDFFHRKVSEADIGNIQDIEVIVNGFFATLFNFGDVRIQTAGADQKTLFFNDVPYPYKAKDIILKFAEENRNADLHKIYTYDAKTKTSQESPPPTQELS